MERVWGNGGRFTLCISSFSLYFPPLYPFPLYQKLYYFSQNVKYDTFVANVTKKNLTYICYALWENNSGSNSLRESSAGCEGLMKIKLRHKISSVCILSKRECKQSILWRQSWRWWWQWWRWSGGLPWCWWRPALPAPRATSSSAALAFRKAGREDMRHVYLLFESSCSISVVVEEATILWKLTLFQWVSCPC